MSKKRNRIVTGLIIGGAVGSVLSLTRKRKQSAEDLRVAGDSDLNPSLSSGKEEGAADSPDFPTEGAEVALAKEAARPIRKTLSFLCRALLAIGKTLWRLLRRAGAR
jgi:hypothetical protein